MNENEIYEQMKQDIVELGNRYSADRIRIATPNFDRDYRRGQDGNLLLVSEKAVIRTHGKVTKVPIGEGQKYATYEEAEAATRKYWSEYYRDVRASRSPAELRAERRRQKRYREKRKERAKRLEEQQ